MLNIFNRNLLLSLLVSGGAFLFISSGVFLGFFEASAHAVESLWQITARIASQEGLENLPKRYYYVIIAFFCIFVSWLSFELPNTLHKITVMMLVLCLVFFATIVAAICGFAFEPFSTLIAVLICFIAGQVISQSSLGLRRKAMQNLLAERVSLPYYNKIMAKISRNNFTEVSRNVTVLTCRCFNHDKIVSKVGSKEHLKIANEFLHNCVTFLLSKEAYLDESNPDTIRVYFGIFEDEEDIALRASNIAIELKHRLENLNAEIKRKWSCNINCGISLTTGIATVGIFNAGEHKYLSAIGIMAEFGRRTCDMNLRYKSSIILDNETFIKIKEKIEVRPLGIINVRNRKFTFEIYELVAKSDELSEEDKKCLNMFWEGVLYYRRGEFRKALQHFQKAKIENQTDPVLENFIQIVRSNMTRNARLKFSENDNNGSGDYKFDIFEYVDII